MTLLLFQESLSSLRAHPLRTALTVSGITVGVAAMVAIAMILEGVTAMVIDSLHGLGAGTFYILPEGNGTKTNRPPRFTDSDFRLLRKEIAGSVDVISLLIETQDTVGHAGRHASATITGSSPELQRAQNIEMNRGRFIAREDADWRRNVCVVGAAIADDLGITANEALPRLRLKDEYLQVIGVLAPRGQRFGVDLDRVVLLPVNTMKKMYLLSTRLSAIGSVVNPDDLPKLSARIERSLRLLHRLKPDDPNDFRVLTQTEILERLSRLRLVVTLAGAGITSLALLVGGIGIMNISLFGAIERIPEIGLRLAVGAKRRWVLQQFLAEAVMIAVIGGMFGVVLGFFSGWVVGMAVGVPFVWSIKAAILGLAAAATTGILFGVYPASQGRLRTTRRRIAAKLV